MIWAIWLLAPTSMPRVGSSRSSTTGSVSMARARTTFCWLPPLSEVTGAPSPGILMESSATFSEATLRSVRCGISPRRASRPIVESSTLSLTLIVWTRPSR